MDIIAQWFSMHPVNILQVVIVSLILKNKNRNTTQTLRDHVVYVINIMKSHTRISIDLGNDLLEAYDTYEDIGMIDDFVEAAYNLSEDPNILNPGFWIPDNTFGRVKNRCIPCRKTYNNSD